LGFNPSARGAFQPVPKLGLSQDEIIKNSEIAGFTLMMIKVML